MKIAVVGSNHCGKSTFIQRLVGLDNEVEYIEIDPFDSTVMKTDNIDGFIVMFDVGSVMSYRHLPVYHRLIRDMYGDLPTIYIGNKSDSKYKLHKSEIQYHKKRNGIEYVECNSLIGDGMETVKQIIDRWRNSPL